MGRAMLIIITGLMISMGYTFMGMSNQRSALTEQSVGSFTKAMGQNLSYTGIQFALDKFNQDSTWRGPESVNIDDDNVQISIDRNGDFLTIISTSKIKESSKTHEIIARYDISEQEQLVPEFNSSLGIATDDFNFFLGGSSNINGYDQTGQCDNAPGVQVQSEAGKDIVGTNSRIDGTPEDEAEVSSLDFGPYADLVDRLEGQPGTKKISGNYKGELGTESDPGVFFIEDYTKLTGGISEGYGIMVVRAGGELDLEGELDIAGNFQFNGLVIFENAWQMDARGTPTINGSVVVGSTDETSVDIDINGNVQLQYDCTARKYADLAAKKDLNDDRIYKPVSIYE